MMDYVFNSSATTKHFIEIALLRRIRVCRAHTIILMIFKKNLQSQMRKSDALSWFFFFWGGDNLLVFQKLLALVFSIQINCYLFDPDAFFL